MTPTCMFWMMVSYFCHFWFLNKFDEYFGMRNYSSCFVSECFKLVLEVRNKYY